jgi:hypothetical protein
MRSFLSTNTTIPIAFKASRCSRRAQLWTRQASIITDLTVLAFRHGWSCFPISVPLLVMPSAAAINGSAGFQADHRIKAPGNFAWIESDPT